MSSRKEFVHLHVHSHNSMLDGFSTQQEIAAACKAMGSRAFALTDHGYVSGLVAAAEAAKDHDIKFIPGVETYVSNDNTAKETRMLKKYPELTDKQRAAENDTFHMLLLATNSQGLRNLYQVSSEGATTGARGRNAKRVTTEHLERYHDGLIGTSGCLSSRVSVHLLRDEYQLALERAALERDIFGAENYYIEIQNHGIDKQLKILGQQLQLAKDLDLPLVATNDSHYTHRHDADAHDHMLAINTRQENKNGGILTPNRFCFDGEEHYIKSADEMFSLFPEDEFPGACTNTVEIAERVDDNIKPSDGSLLIPEFEYAEFGYDSADDMLRDRVLSGLDELLDGDVPSRYIDQMEFELNVIRNMGIQSYFLIVAAIMQFCRENGIYVGPGRGSAAGSVVVYGLRITKVDPIRHDLIFSRFLNAGRTDSMPDIDVDIESGRRHEVVAYMARRWGSDRVVNINTLQTFKAKSSLKKIGAVHEVQRSNGTVKNYDKEATEAANKLEPTGDPHLSVVLADKPPHNDDPSKQKKLDEEWNSGSALREFINASSDEEVAVVAELAASLERRNFTNGIHPAGVLITPGPVREYFPIRKAKSKKDADPDELLLDVCQFDCVEVDKLNGLKMDLLALKNLTVLEATVHKIQRDLGEDIDLDSIPLDDPAVYKMLQQGDSNGVFQIESSGMKELMRKVRPTSFDDISALIALFRPGPMGMDSHNIYADRKNGRSKVEYFHEDAREALEDTYGLVVYQEQVMRLSQKFAGFSEKEADDFRKAMGKKKQSVMEAMHADFVQRVADNGYTEALGKTIWDTVEPFAGYAFNKAHSVSYGYITYQTAWLKAHYYPQFVGAFIDVFPKRSSAMSSEAISRGYAVGAPDINRSFVDSTTRDNRINIGFNRVANFGDEAAQNVVDEREKNGDFTSIVDFCGRTGTKKNSVESLIKAGAFDSLASHDDRIAMLDQIDDIAAAGKRVAARRHNSSAFGGRSLLDISGVKASGIDDPMESFNFDSKTVSSRQRRIFERDSLGFFVGEHPFQDFADQIDDLRETVPAMESALSLQEVIQNKVVGRGNFFGVLTEYNESTSKRGNAMTRFVLDCGDQSDVSGMVMGHGYFTEDDLMSLVLVDGFIEEDEFLSSQEIDSHDATTDHDDGPKKETPFYARFGFGAKPFVVKRSADSGINDSVMSVQSREVDTTAAKRSAKDKRESRSTVRKSTVRKREERAPRPERGGSDKSNVDTLRTVRRQIVQRKKNSDKKYAERAFCVKFNSSEEERAELIFQYVLLWIAKYAEKEGRQASVIVNGERCDTELLVTDSGMTKLRQELRKLATLTQTTISIGEY